MKKLMMLAAMVTMTFVAAIPALAIEIGQENGAVDQTFEVSSSGDRWL
jgi:hypothetical protein